jgi:hypothetical protein
MKKLVLIVLTFFILNNLFAQKVLYGFNIEKLYGSRYSPTKTISLTDKSIFCQVQINFGGDELLFSQFCKTYNPFPNNEKKFPKCLQDIKKVFGNPINIYSDKEFTKKSETFFFWKILLNKKYYVIHYFLLGELHLHINKYSNEEEANKEIISLLQDPTMYDGKYFLNPDENNIY